MDHAYAMEKQIAEGYLLGDLTNEEAEAYEAHYFECEQCADYIREELTMLEIGRAVALEEKRKTTAETAAAPAPPIAPVVDLAEQRVTRRGWLPVAAAAMLGAVLVAPLSLRTGGPTVERGQTINVTSSLSRTNAADQPVVQAGRPATIFVAIDSVQHPYPNFDLTIRDAGSKKQIDEPIRVSADETSDDVPLQLSALPAGNYEVVIEGVREEGKRAEITVSPFQVQ